MEDLLGRMTLAEKVGQMTQPGRRDLRNPDLVARHGFGSVLFGAGSAPRDNSVKGWSEEIARLQRAAKRSRLGIPLLIGVDAVHGHNNLAGATVFPHNIGLGATRDPDLVRRIGEITAAETRATGPNWVFSPCLCVARDNRWGRTYESFGEDPRLVSDMAVIIEGLQGDGLDELAMPDHVLATAKHFAGDGLTGYGPPASGTGYRIDQGTAVVTRREFEQLAIAPYRTAVEEHDVASVMTSFSSTDFPGDGVGPRKSTADRQLLTGRLKRDLDFHGIVVTDYRAIHQLPGDLEQQVTTSVNAGADVFMEAEAGAGPAWREFADVLIRLVRDGVVPMRRIDDAVGRVLRAKFLLGLFDDPRMPSGAADVGSAEHRTVAREAVAASQVLLMNRETTLPLDPGRRPIYVAGSNGHDLGNQAGGWTLSWQGGDAPGLTGQTILDGIRDAAPPTSRVLWSERASMAVPEDALGVVVVGEEPYAEGWGDVGGPRWPGPGDGSIPERGPHTMRLSPSDVNAITTVCRSALSCTVLVVSGRPLEIPAGVLKDIDALVASWLPGSEGGGVSDVLFGDRPFSGRLPVTWPRRASDEPINAPGPRALFPFGFGMST